MNKIKEWLKTTPYKSYSIRISSTDASFRKYYRLTNADNKTVLLMDSSLEKESLKPFLNVTEKLLSAKVNVPLILEQSLENGFLIIKDFGSTHYLDILNNINYKTMYTKAIDCILNMQKADASNLPIYDKTFLHFEMNLMRDWYLQKRLKITLSEAEEELIEKTFNTISNIVLQQPQNTFVHRDFHSRNIMLTNNDRIGVIDYQDAMNGAITYDLVSLLKDCYISYKREEIEKLVLEFRDKKSINIDNKTFIKWFDFMGLQRHIKVLGIFSRLSIRDKKDCYLKDIPLTLKYIIDTASRYDETKKLAEFLKAKC
ncbi:MAG: phosphotransferase [Sulfurimonas sp.]|nr:phosphotransferase [Sulfurimonas sp.]